jgi:hypothetical protein
LFPKIKSVLKGRISGYLRHPKECDSNEKYSTRGVPKMFPRAAASLG